MKVPTDLEILEAIYTLCYHEFASFRKESPNARNAKVYVPIDVDKIASHLSVEKDIVFGRLYYHLNNKYSYTKPNKTKVEFFALALGPEDKREVDCIQFPLMVSVLAELRYEQKVRRRNKPVDTCPAGVGHCDSYFNF
jgi:hypothetical protein